MAFPYATLCVQGLKDGVCPDALEAQFEEYGRVRNVSLTKNRHMKGVSDTQIALVEFARRDDARRAMQALNGRNVQGKCATIRFAKSSPGNRPAISRNAHPELIPQTAKHAKLLAAKFQASDERSATRSKSRRRRRGKDDKDSRSRDHRHRSQNRSGSKTRRRSCRHSQQRSRSRYGETSNAEADTKEERSRSASHWRPTFSDDEEFLEFRDQNGSPSRSHRRRARD